MGSKNVHVFLFQLYDYADYLAGKIQPGNSDNGNYFISLLYIEEMMDSYGRSLICASAKDAGADESAALSEAHRRIDLLRGRIQSLYQEFDFDEILERKTEKLLRDWHRH